VSAAGSADRQTVPGRHAPAHRRWHRRWRHSLHWRLVTLFGVLALATVAVFLSGAQRLVASGWQAYAQPLLADYADRLAAEIGSPPDLARVRAIEARLPVAIRIDGPVVHYRSAAQAPWMDGRDDDARAHWAFARQTADGHTIRFGLGAPAAELRRPLHAWLTLALLLGLTALAFAGVRRLFKPLEAIGRGVERYGQGDFSEPIVVRRDDELGDLAARINRMADSLHGRLQAKRQLLLAISHELRSPLTRARVNAELLDERPERSALLADLGAMRDLITDLLESERLAGGHAVLHAEPTDLARLAREVADAAVAGGAGPVELDLSLPQPTRRVDAARLRLLLRNLLANALRHGAGAPRPPQVFLRAHGEGGWTLGVRDHGPGVPPAQLARLTEAFYRPDSARTRAAGGVGLGLYLCRLVAEAHGGTLVLSAASPGLSVAMQCPARLETAATEGGGGATASA
jgi:signal transduction histidine kinase